MSARWLAPVLALAALVGSAGTLPAKNGDLVFEFSTDPVEVKTKLPDLDVRPNTAQAFYLFVRNKSDDVRDITVQIWSADKRTLLAEAKLMRVPRDTAEKPNVVRVTLAKPAPPMPAAGAAAPMPMPMPPAVTAGGPMANPMTPPTPPGLDLPAATGANVVKSQFPFRIRAFDDRDKENASEDFPIAIGIREPTAYVKPEGIKYTKSAASNLLTVPVKPTDQFVGAEPAPVDLVFPPQRLVKVDAMREGVFRRRLTKTTATESLYAKDIPLRGGSATDKGTFYINVDGVPRAYVYQHALLTEASGAAITQLAPADIRLYEHDRNDNFAVDVPAPPTIFTRPRILPLRVEADTTLTNATFQVILRKASGENVDVITRPTTRDRHVWLDAGAAEGGLLVTSRVGDWVLPLDLRDVRGRYVLHADLLLTDGAKSPFFERTLVVDDTKPEKVAIEVLPGRDPKIDPVKHLRTKPIPVRVIASDPESGISRVVVFFGKVAPDGKLPEGVIDAKLLTEGGETWVIDLPLPPPAAPAPPPMPGAPVIVLPPKLLDVTAIVVNGVGLLSEPISLRIQLLDPPTGGIIKATVQLGAGGKPLKGVKVIMVDMADGKQKAAGTTDEKTGVAVFKDVPPGSYRLLSAKPDAGVGTKGQEDVSILAGEEKPVKIILSRRP